MKLKLITQCETLNFLPVSASSSICPVAFSDYIIAGFNLKQEYALDLEEPCEDLFKKLYPKLTLPELARLNQLLVQNRIPYNPEILFHNYQLKWSEDLQNILESLLKTSQEFQNWASLKDFSVNELRILNYAFGKTMGSKSLLDFLDFVAKTNPSRQHGAKIIEYGIELFNDSLLLEIQNMTSGEALFHYLHAKRFPRTSELDAQFAQKVQSFPWPAHIKAQWTRQGDSAGVEVKFFSSNPQDFSQKTSKLSDLKDRAAKDIWN